MATLSIQNSAGTATTLTPQAAGGPLSVTLPANSGTILTTPLAAGSASGAPIVFTTGTLASPAPAGGLEYNGFSPIFTPQNTQRSVIQASQYFCLNANLPTSNVNTSQSFFGHTAGPALTASTIYEFEMYVAIVKAAATTISHNFSILIGGTATLNWVGYDLQYFYNVTGFTSAPTVSAYWFIPVATATTLLSANTAATATYGILKVKGLVSINAAGTFIPQFILSAAPGPLYTVQQGSYIKLSPLGVAGGNINIGNWTSTI
jgi:hypothetical protein